MNKQTILELASNENMANKSIAPNATDLVACGQAAGEFLYDGDFTIIPNAIDTDLFLYNENQRAKIRHQYDIDDETTVYGHVGGLNYIKNHQFLINVFYQVHLQNKNTKLLLVGAGDLLESLQEQVKSLNLEDAVIFAGLQTDVPAYLSAMDVFVFPSLFEGMPYVLLEAQNNGLPIICTKNIDPSVQITDLIQRVDIKDEAAWIQALLTTNHSERQSYDNEVKLSGYDLASLADLMAKVYRRI